MPDFLQLFFTEHHKHYNFYRPQPHDYETWDKDNDEIDGLIRTRLVYNFTCFGKYFPWESGMTSDFQTEFKYSSTSVFKTKDL